MKKELRKIAAKVVGDCTWEQIFELNREVYAQNCINKLKQENFSDQKSSLNKTICMDYSSPNIVDESAVLIEYLNLK